MVDVTFVRPRFDEHDAARIVHTHYGLDATASGLPSERDLNFLITGSDGQRFVLKIANTTEDQGVIDLQNQALLQLAACAPDLRLPRLVPTMGRMAGAFVPDASGRPHAVRMLTWVPGRVLASVKPHTPELLQSLGTLLGRLDGALATFDHPAADRSLKWDPKKAAWVRPYVAQIPDPARRALVERLSTWSDEILERLDPSLPVSVIYNDANDHNVLVDGDDPYARRVVSVIDFGDMVRTWTVNELAVAAAYAMLDKPDPLHAALPIVAGYHAERPLADVEIEALLPLVCRRLCVSVVNSAYQRTREPGNAYLTISERSAWALLQQLAEVHPRLARDLFRDACGHEPCPNSGAVVRWLQRRQGEIGPLLDPDPATAARRVLDFSMSSLEAGTPQMWSSPQMFSRHVRGLMREQGAAVGVG